MIYSKPVFVLNPPVVSDIMGSFKYYYFTPGESLSDGDDDPSNDIRTLNLYGPPRAIEISISHSLSDLAADSPVTETMAKDILTYSNMQKSEAEAQLQTMNASKLTFKIDNEFLSHLYNHPDYNGSNDHYEAITKLMSNLDEESTKILAKVLEDTGCPGPIQFDPTTNKVISDLNEVRSMNTSNATIMDFALGDLVTGLIGDHFSSFADDFLLFEKRAIDRQSESRIIHTPGYLNLSDFELKIEEIAINENNPELQALIDPANQNFGVYPIAYILYKTRISGDQRIPENPILLSSKSKKNIIDYSVKYGQRYEYSLHTVSLTKLRSSAGGSHFFLFTSGKGKKISILCEEKNPPVTVSDMRFTFLNSTMVLEWDLPIQIGAGGTKAPLNDLKYVQIFERDSINQPFRLIRMCDFNDSLSPYPLRETVSKKLIKKTTRNDNRLILPLPDKGKPKIYSIATVDAHGNSSGYCAQFMVFLDSLNQPKLRHIAYPGAPKQYPNLTIVDNIFKDSIQVSDYKKITIYHNPNFTVLHNERNEENMVSLALENDTATYLLQLIDIDTQKDERVEITMKQVDPNQFSPSSE